MDKEIKEQFVAALRSGKYPRASGMLARVDRADGPTVVAGYCCLGVACELAIKSGVQIDVGFTWESMGASSSGAKHYNQNDTYLPQEVKDWLGVDEYNPVVPGLMGRPSRSGGDPEVQMLADLNDHGLTFDQLADLIDYFF